MSTLNHGGVCYNSLTQSFVLVQVKGLSLWAETLHIALTKAQTQNLQKSSIFSRDHWVPETIP